MHPLVLQKLLRPLLRPLGSAYGRLMAERRRRWEAGGKARFRPPCPCVSVGNIAWGGTGKTPLVDWLLGWAEDHALAAVVLTRGYGAKPSRLPLVVEASHTAAEAGDEPLMLRQGHPQSHVLVDPVRRRSGALAAARFSPQLMILDDGMQHLAVDRDLDLVLLRPADVLGEWNAVIPCGSWRENASALNRAGAFLIKATPRHFDALRPCFERHLAGFGRPLFSFNLEPAGFLPVGTKVPSCAPSPGQPYGLLTGVGEPAQVAETLTGFMGNAPVRHWIFADHHPYTAADLAQVATAAGSLPVICTAKDAVKLAPLASLPFPTPGSGYAGVASRFQLWSLRTRARFGPALWTDQSFPCWWENWWNSQQVTTA